jgi:hypothetical protein
MLTKESLPEDRSAVPLQGENVMSDRFSAPKEYREHHAKASFNTEQFYGPKSPGHPQSASSPKVQEPCRLVSNSDYNHEKYVAVNLDTGGRSKTHDISSSLGDDVPRGFNSRHEPSLGVT